MILQPKVNYWNTFKSCFKYCKKNYRFLQAFIVVIISLLNLYTTVLDDTTDTVIVRVDYVFYLWFSPVVFWFCIYLPLNFFKKFFSLVKSYLNSFKIDYSPLLELRYSIVYGVYLIYSFFKGWLQYCFFNFFWGIFVAMNDLHLGVWLCDMEEVVLLNEASKLGFDFKNTYDFLMWDLPRWILYTLYIYAPKVYMAMEFKYGCINLIVLVSIYLRILCNLDEVEKQTKEFIKGFSK